MTAPAPVSASGGGGKETPKRSFSVNDATPLPDNDISSMMQQQVPTEHMSLDWNLYKTSVDGKKKLTLYDEIRCSIDLRRLQALKR